MTRHEHMWNSLDNQLVVRSAIQAATQRAKWLTYFVLSWTLNIAAIAGVFGDIIQVIAAILMVIWFFSVHAAHKMGLLPLALRFWKSVIIGR